MRVLVIEDDSSIVQSIELMLKSECFNVYTTDLGEEGSILAGFTTTTSSCSI
jgi:two-component system, cell cycle response regulator CtrA